MPWRSPTGSTRPASGEVIGLDVSAAETEALSREFLRSLIRRGLQGVQRKCPAVSVAAEPLLFGTCG
jgi:transposase-like protein